MNLIVSCLLLAAPSAAPSDVPEIQGVIATPVQFGKDARQKIALASLELLASCAHSASASEEDWLQALNQCHLVIKFPQPSKTTVGGAQEVIVHEMLITLPLASGGIWVRSGKRVDYFAKFDPKRSWKIQELLREAKPAGG